MTPPGNSDNVEVKTCETFRLPQQRVKLWQWRSQTWVVGVLKLLPWRSQTLFSFSLSGEGYCYRFPQLQQALCRGGGDSLQHRY